MHNYFYASGFLYHPKSQQILLQQENSTDSDNTWSLFGGENKGKEIFEETFLRVINAHLNLNIKPTAIFPIYNYLHRTTNKNTYLFYAKVTKLEKFSDKKRVFTWFTFKQIQKLALSDQIKQDIIVGQRVIDSYMRKSLGLQTIG
jgi:ADP-ribose pyrophosphatase YjhB (NUDIX family)